MKKTLLVSIFSAVILSGCNQATQTEQASTMPNNPMCNNEAMPGGWSPEEMTPEVEQAVNTVLAQMNNASPLKQITDVRTQVVAGMNYAVEFELENGQIWHAVVFHSLDDSYTVTEVAKQGKICG